MTNPKTYSDFLTRKQAERDRVVKELDALRQSRELLSVTLADTESARDVVNAVLLLTQEAVRGFVEDVVSLALSTVYGSAYSFELEYDIKRNQSEATPWIVIQDMRVSLREEVGGGVNDIASFAMRLALWAISSPRSANFFVFDEPAKFVSRDKQPLFGEMLQELSKMLGIQILLVSHSTDIINTADRAYNVELVNGVSQVERI